MEVKEIITVTAEGNQIKRGIFRDFPTRYRDRLGNRYSVGFQVVHVLRNGETEPYAVEQIPRGKRVRIGNADVFIDEGEHTYEIVYETHRQLGYFETYDELYWNATGDEWAFPIDRAAAVITLPPTVPRNEVRLEAYTGPKGSTNRKTWAIGLVIALVTMAGVVLTGREPAVGLFMGIWLTFWTCGVAILGWMVVTRWKDAIHGTYKILSTFGTIFITLFALPFVAAECFAIYELSKSTSPAAMVIMVLIFIILVLFYHWMKAPTYLGRRLLDELEGFRRYLSMKMPERMKLMHAPAKSPQLFEAHLPYAIAMDVDHEWGEYFADMLEAAGQGGGKATPTPTHWYSSNTDRFLRAGAIGGAIGGALASAVSTSSQAPGSSSGSSSGGGGGGGGG